MPRDKDTSDIEAPDDERPAPLPASAMPPRAGAEGEPPLPASAEEPPGRPPLSGLPVLRLIRPLAVLAVLAMLLGRMLAPAAAGLAVGIGHLVRVVEIAGGALSQLFAMGAVVVAMALLSAVTRSQIHAAYRVGSLVAGSFVILVVLHAAVERVPGPSAALIGVCAALIAAGAAWDALRTPFARPAAVVLGLCAVGALARLGAVALAVRAGTSNSAAMAGAARDIATGAFGLDGLAILIATATLAGRERAARPEGTADPGGQPRLGPQAPRLTSPLTLAALAIALLVTRQALAGGVEDASKLDVLLRRALDPLIPRPLALVPLGVQVFASALAVVVTLLLLVVPARAPAIAGALALALVARSAPEVPLGALSLVIAAFSIALAARDERGFWAAVLAGDRARGGGGPGP